MSFNHQWLIALMARDLGAPHPTLDEIIKRARARGGAPPPGLDEIINRAREQFGPAPPRSLWSRITEAWQGIDIVDVSVKATLACFALLLACLAFLMCLFTGIVFVEAL